EEELYTYENSCVPTCGSCSFYGTANTMCCVSEAMGIVPSGGAAIPAYHMDRLRMAEYTGEIPATKSYMCGNYLDHNLEITKIECKKFLDEVLLNIKEENMVYPMQNY
ncbi:MAG: S-ribosylhomocysteine lyase, partial [Firmicutes bacterium]|nr:S-ribosylhomocysteine lyase [Bacillota bacterium]